MLNTQFKYFKGPEEDMSSLIEGVVICSICGIEDRCFELDFSTTNEFNEDEKKEGKVGCINCLRNGKFEFWHDTEFGMLGEKGLHKVYKHNLVNPPSVDQSTLVELRRTPQIITWQQELWLTHCDDFMIYTGTWEPKDFHTNSKDGDGRRLFMEMTDDEYNNLWDDSLEEGQTKLEEWYPTYYVFECSHCGKLRGNWDCD
jgi:uncharacterized protein CbrC (UPF0167 family)